MLEETFREFEQKVRQEARQEGRREGEVEGMQKMAVEMLRQRFGRLPQAVRERVLAISSTAKLKKLTRRIMTANSLQETGLV